MRWFRVSRKGGTGGSGWGHLQGAVHMEAARLGFEKALVGTGRTTPPPLTAWTGLENITLTLQRAGFWQEKLLEL